MSFKRRTVIEINFDESTIINSDVYREFAENNPNLKSSIDNLIMEFVKWAKNPPNKDDFYCCPGNSLPYQSCWSIDENTYDGELGDQIGTTGKKFELKTTMMTNEESYLIGEVFEKIGFNVFVVTSYQHHNVYNFDFVKLSDVKGNIKYPNKNNGIEFISICVSI